MYARLLPYEMICFANRLFLSNFLLLQRLTHAAKSYALDSHELVNTVLAALTAEATLLHTAESIETLVPDIQICEDVTYGDATSLIKPVLTPTMPTSRASATRKMRRTLPLKK
jgi:hypothetical protein